MRSTSVSILSLVNWDFGRKLDDKGGRPIMLCRAADIRSSNMGPSVRTRLIASGVSHVAFAMESGLFLFGIMVRVDWSITVFVRGMNDYFTVNTNDRCFESVFVDITSRQLF